MGTLSIMQTNLSIKHWGFYLLLLAGTPVFSQSFVDYYDGYGTDFQEFTHGNIIISTTGNFYVNSSAITNSLINLSYGTERFVSKEIKNDISAKLSENNNRYGKEANFGFEYKQLKERFLGKDSATFSIGYYLRDIQYMKLSKDAVDIYFRGNAPYAGETKYAKANLTAFYMNQIRAGFEHVANGSKWGLGASVLLGARYQNLNLARGELFTQEDGEYVDFNTDISFAYVGDAEAQFYELNGAGLSFDFFLQKKVNKTDYLKIAVSDLGFIQWANTSVVEADTNIHFEGAEVSNLFNFNEDNYEFPNDSLLDYFGLKAEQKGKTQWLPTTLDISYYHQFSSRLSLTTGVRYMANAAYLPKLFLVGSYGQRAAIQVNAIASLGGYGNFLGGLGIEKLFSDKLGVNFNCYMFGMAFAPSTSTGQAADIKIYAIF